MTLMRRCRKNEACVEIENICREEKISSGELTVLVSGGQAVVTGYGASRTRTIKPVGIGRGLRTKINANIGTSRDNIDEGEEILKLQTAVDAGADTIMDLSTGGDLARIRRTIMAESPVPVGTVPIYQAIVEAVEKKKTIKNMTPDLLFDVIEEHAADGVDFVTVHCGVTRFVLEKLKKSRRLMGIISRGGTFLAEWMTLNNRENPLYEQFDRLLEIAARYDLVLSLGDGLRPGAIADATDEAQVEELTVLGELTRVAWEKGVQVIVEGPGHVPLNQIEENIRMQKKICRGAPFYVLGPLVTDLAPGYDHISGAIGGAVAAGAGADFLCYLTPSEHLRLPTVEDVRVGVIASRIAAHAADIAKGIPEVSRPDDQMSRARRDLDWEEQIRLSFDPEKARAIHETGGRTKEETCTMCGEYCAIKIGKEFSE
jgi:phosphomethylpyrimidine synthase